MKILNGNLTSCEKASGLVVVIDVIRAFSAAAFAFGLGAKRIILAGEVAEAISLRGRFEDAILMGEDRGIRPDGFDYGNSPGELMSGPGFAGGTIIQRTSRGTQGVVRATNASLLLTASFSNAQATVDYIRSLSPAMVWMINTGADASGYGDEDAACADYLRDLLLGEDVEPEPYLERVKNSKINREVFANPDKPNYPAADIALCTDLDRHDFAMVVDRVDGLLVMHPARVKVEIVG